MNQSVFDWQKECRFIGVCTEFNGRMEQFNNDPACFVRYCEMQRNQATKQGRHDSATYIQECIDDIKA